MKVLSEVETSRLRKTRTWFVGVTFKHNARYYISGIGSKSTKEGIVRYIESRGAVVLPYLTSYCLNQNFLEGD